MPHYKDGTPAKVGDRVRGKGYNLKDVDGNPLVIEGIVTEVRPNRSMDGKDYDGACSLTVIYLRLGDKDNYIIGREITLPSGLVFYLDSEYGDTVGFDLMPKQRR